MKRALVTGSTQGIGRAIAEMLVKDGFSVIVHCSADEEKAERVRAEIGAELAVTCDLSKPDEVSALKQKTGDVDVLVLNASVQYKQKWQDVSEQNMQNQLQVNVISTLRLMQAYYPYMQKNGFGRIITIGSVNQHRRHPELGFYAATKCAVMSLVENVAKEVARYGVTVNNVSPGAIATPRNAAVYNDAEARKKVEACIPVGRFGTPEECAGIVAFLASEQSSYITGADIKTDGGMSL
ncbi:MAG: SDR family NAD(P)-dependent oxidoreductase [Candidatus Neoclostridium sp.]